MDEILRWYPRNRSAQGGDLSFIGVAHWRKVEEWLQLHGGEFEDRYDELYGDGGSD